MSEDILTPHRKIIFATTIRTTSWLQVERHLSLLREGIVIDRHFRNIANGNGVSNGLVMMTENAGLPQRWYWNWAGEHKRRSSTIPYDALTTYRVKLRRVELFEMLNIINEMIAWCGKHMPYDLFQQTKNAAWVIAHRADGRHADADMLKSDMMRARQGIL